MKCPNEKYHILEFKTFFDTYALSREVKVTSGKLAGGG